MIIPEEPLQEELVNDTAAVGKARSRPKIFNLFPPHREGYPCERSGSTFVPISCWHITGSTYTAGRSYYSQWFLQQVKLFPKLLRHRDISNDFGPDD